MKLLTKAQTTKLLKNGLGQIENCKPVVKFFNPTGGQTWLFSELDANGDTLFGLADLGWGQPELGYSSLSEIQSIKGQFGLKIERDLHFKATKTIAEYADEARETGRIAA